MSTNNPSIEFSESNLFLHPLPLLNISDYCTRGRLKGQTIFIGALLGTRTGRDITIHNACELLINLQDGAPFVDMQYLQRKVELYQTNFPDDSLLGWFYINTQTTTLSPDSTCLKVQEQISQLYDVPILVIFTPVPRTQSVTSQLPLKCYEVVYRNIDGISITTFIEVIHIKIESEEAERIGVDDIIREGQSHGDDDVTPDGELGKSMLASHLTKESKAIEIFLNRLTTIQSYVKAVRNGQLPSHRALLRQINACIEQLTRNSINDPEYPELGDFLNKQEFQVLTSYLNAAITSGERLSLELSSKRLYVAKHSGDTSTPTGDYSEAL